MTSRIAIALMCAVIFFAQAHATALEFVAESERSSLWELQSSDVPPRLGMYLRPGYSVAFEIEYTIQTDGTVGDAAVVETTDSALPNELLMELISSHRYRPAARNEGRIPIRTRMKFRLGAAEAGAAAKVCPGSIDTVDPACPK